MLPTEGRVGALGVIEGAALLIEEGRIAWCGAEERLPAGAKVARSMDAKGMVVLPGLVECHTHIVHAGYRQGEFDQRSRGKSYREIASEGGGIMSTVRSTRSAGADELAASAGGRIDELISRGVTSVEVKTGYGLDYDAEMKIVQAIDDLSRSSRARILGTFLGAHVVPPEYHGRRGDYVDLIVDRMMRDAAKFEVITACDVFVEEGAYTAEEARHIAHAAKALGLAVHLHVDQFSDVDGGRLAAELGALSADHLDRTSDAGMEAMAEAGVVGVCLPGASLFAGSGGYPNARGMIDRGVRVAISTDYNPGTSPCLDPWLMATIAVTRMGMSCDEALLGLTKNAAAALGLEDAGTVAPGMRADLAFIDAPDERFPLYRFGSNFVSKTMIGGEVAWGEI